jgi:hypothetical protein
MEVQCQCFWLTSCASKDGARKRHSPGTSTFPWFRLRLGWHVGATKASPAIPFLLSQRTQLCSGTRRALFANGLPMGPSGLFPHPRLHSRL